MVNVLSLLCEFWLTRAVQSHVIQLLADALLGTHESIGSATLLDTKRPSGIEAKENARPTTGVESETELCKNCETYIPKMGMVG